MEIVFKNSNREGMRRLSAGHSYYLSARNYCKSIAGTKNLQRLFSLEEIKCSQQTDKLTGLPLWKGSFLKSLVGFVSGDHSFLHPMF